MTPTCRKAGAELGINADTLRGCAKQAQINQGLRPGTTSADAARIRALEKENAELRKVMFSELEHLVSVLSRGGEAEIDGLAAVVAVELGEFVLGADKADLESFDLAEPAFAFGLGYAAARLSRISAMWGRCAGSSQSMGHRRQASLN